MIIKKNIHLKRFFYRTIFQILEFLFQNLFSENVQRTANIIANDPSPSGPRLGRKDNYIFPRYSIWNLKKWYRP